MVMTKIKRIFTIPLQVQFSPDPNWLCFEVLTPFGEWPSEDDLRTELNRILVDGIDDSWSLWMTTLSQRDTSQGSKHLVFAVYSDKELTPMVTDGFFHSDLKLVGQSLSSKTPNHFDIYNKQGFAVAVLVVEGQWQGMWKIYGDEPELTVSKVAKQLQIDVEISNESPKETALDWIGQAFALDLDMRSFAIRKSRKWHVEKILYIKALVGLTLMFILALFPFAYITYEKSQNIAGMERHNQKLLSKWHQAQELSLSMSSKKQELQPKYDEYRSRPDWSKLLNTVSTCYDRDSSLTVESAVASTVSLQITGKVENWGASERWNNCLSQAGLQVSPRKREQDSDGKIYFEMELRQ